MTHKHNFLFIGIAVVLVILGALVFMYMSLNYNSDIRATEGILQNNAPTPPRASSAQNQSLGTELYDKSKNSTQNKVPGLTPTTNPIQGAYQNPFE